MYTLNNKKGSRSCYFKKFFIKLAACQNKNFSVSMTTKVVKNAVVIFVDKQNFVLE